MSNVSPYPHSQRAKYTPYKEAWHLLRAEASGRIDIMACVEGTNPTEVEALPLELQQEISKKTE